MASCPANAADVPGRWLLHPRRQPLPESRCSFPWGKQRRPSHPYAPPTAPRGLPLDAPDVFISYSHTEDDEKWVVEKLEPFLVQNGCRVCRDDQIPPGDDYQQWLCDHIAASRHVLVVLTKASVKSRYVRIELDRVVNEDPEGNKSKLVPILLKDCEVPAHIVPSFIERINLTIPDPDAGAADDQADRGRARAGAPRWRATGVRPSHPGGHSVVLASPEGQKLVADFQAKLSTACDLIDQIEEFKKLHDGLHKLTDRCQLVGRQVKQLSCGDGAWEEFAEQGRELARDLEDLVSAAQESPFGPA